MAKYQEVQVSEPRPRDECYPQREAHIWNEFALGAVELGGYNDITAIDPYSGRRFWMSNAFVDENGDQRSIYGTLRLLIDRMEQEKFLG